MALLVEDNPLDVILVEEAIVRHGVSIHLHVATDGAEAIAFIEAAEKTPGSPGPDLLILDLNLPKRSGREVLERLRATKRYGSIPVLIMSSSELTADFDLVSEEGANRYFRKPNHYEQFMEVGLVLRQLLAERARM